MTTTLRITVLVFNPNYAIDDLLRDETTAKQGTSSNFTSHRNGATIARQKSLWSPLFYCTFFSHYENLLHKSGLTDNSEDTLSAGYCGGGFEGIRLFGEFVIATLC